MGKTLRTRCIVIAIVFILITACGTIAVLSFGDKLLLSAFLYGSGSKEDPYRIYTSNQLLSLQEVSSSKIARKYTQDKFFVLCNDVTLRTVPSETTGGFFGHLDGNGHTIFVDNGALFYRLEEGATASNLQLVIKRQKWTYKTNFILANKVEKEAIIQDCIISGDIIVDYSRYNSFPFSVVKCYSAPFCLINEGVIQNCEYYGDITSEKSGAVAFSYLAGIAYSGDDGVIINCSFKGNIDIVSIGAFEIVAGLSSSNHIFESSFVGNIIIKKREDSRYRFTGNRCTVYGLGRMIQDGAFIGNILFDKSKPISCCIAGEESTYSMEGTMKRIMEDGSVELLP